MKLAIPVLLVLMAMAALGQQAEIMQQLRSQAAELGLDEREVDRLEQRGLGWADIRMGLALAAEVSRESGIPIKAAFDQVITAYLSGQRWQRLAELRGVNLSEALEALPLPEDKKEPYPGTVWPGIQDDPDELTIRGI